MAHSTLGPSKAKQWMNCPGSIALCAKAPPQAPNENAAEGTVAHDLAYKFVTGKIDSLEMMELVGTTVMQEGFEIEITEAMFDAAVEYKELVASLRAELLAAGKAKPVVEHAEERVHATSIDEQVWGTTDYALYIKGYKLIVLDFKYGQGVIVDPEENEQGAIYALGVLDHILKAPIDAFDEIEIIIHQPRGRHADGPVRRWVVPKDWLKKFCGEAKVAAAETRKPGAKVAAGSWCRWCAAKPFCPAVHNAAQEAAMSTFSVPPNPLLEKAVNRIDEVRLLSIEQLGRVLEWEGAVKALFEAVKDVVRERLTSGQAVPGWKLVDGREGNREWIDEDAVVAEFGPVLGVDNLYAPRKILGPAKIEKLVGKKHKIDHLVQRKPGEKAIARDTDPRPIAATAAQDTFQVIEPAQHAEAATAAVDDMFAALNAPAETDDIMSQLGGKTEKMWPQ